MTDRFNRARLRTVHLVPVTAMRASGELNPEVQQEHTARLYTAGIRAFMPGAGTGEFHSLAADEIVELVTLTRQAAGDDALIFVPVGLQLAHALELGERGLAAGADGVLVMPLPHPYVHDRGARDYYLAVLERFRCPALLYKTAPVPSDELLLELAGTGLIHGVKYSLNNLSDFRRTVVADGGRIEWLCGSAERFAPYYMLAGASGYTSGAGNLCPRLSLAMHRALIEGRMADAMRLQQSILPVENFRARDGDSFNIGMLKSALASMGLDVGPPRPPQRRLSAGEESEVRRLMEPLLRAEAAA